MSMFRPLIRSLLGRMLEIGNSDQLLVPGGVRTRPGNTGGGDALVRHVYLGPAGFLYITDVDGNRVGFIGPDGEPAASLVLGGGSGPGGSADSIEIDLDTGIATIPQLLTTTQDATDDSDNAATTAFVHDVVDDLVSHFPATFGAGSKGGSPIAIGNDDATGIADQAFTIGAGWRLMVYPSVSSGTFSVDLRRKATGSYPPSGSGDSICGGSPVTITSGVEASGATSGWTTAINQYDALAATVTVNSAGVRWFRLIIPSTREL